MQEYEKEHFYSIQSKMLCMCGNVKSVLNVWFTDVAVPLFCVEYVTVII